MSITPLERHNQRSAYITTAMNQLQMFMDNVSMSNDGTPLSFRYEADEISKMLYSMLVSLNVCFHRDNEQP